jgi:hypothetical protein
MARASLRLLWSVLTDNEYAVTQGEALIRIVGNGGV